jgi:hypothetical protein
MDAFQYFWNLAFADVLDQGVDEERTAHLAKRVDSGKDEDLIIIPFVCIEYGVEQGLLGNRLAPTDIFLLLGLPRIVEFLERHLGSVLIVQLTVVLDFKLAVLAREVDYRCNPGEKEAAAAAESCA